MNWLFEIPWIQVTVLLPIRHFFDNFFIQSSSSFIVLHSDSITHHAELLHRSYNQKPDRILRKRKKYGVLFTDDASLITSTGVHQHGDKQMTLAVQNGHHQTTNPLVKVAVWTMTVSMGVMTYFVLNTSKYWLWCALWFHINDLVFSWN